MATSPCNAPYTLPTVAVVESVSRPACLDLVRSSLVQPVYPSERLREAGSVGNHPQGDPKGFVCGVGRESGSDQGGGPHLGVGYTQSRVAGVRESGSGTRRVRRCTSV